MRLLGSNCSRSISVLIRMQNMAGVNKEKAIRAIVSSFVDAYASGFSDRHIAEVSDEDNARIFL